MKLLFDPIYSTNPRRCSSALKFKVLAEFLVQDPTMFIYWRIPEWADGNDMEWLPKSQQIKYLKCEHAQANRLIEYQIIRPDLQDHVWAFGSIWDWDVCITMRTAMVPAMRLLATPPRSTPKMPQKSFFILEEMAVLRGKKTVATTQLETQDMVTLSGYIDADLTLIAANNVRSMILEETRAYFQPSISMKLKDRVRLIRPVDLPMMLDKRTTGGYPKEGEIPHVIFSGRMNASSSRLSSIFKVLTVDFAYNRESEDNFSVSSVTKAPQLPPPSFLDVKNNDREKFWELLRSKAHVGLYMAIDAEFSLTVLEPICFGVPLVLVREDWSESLIGKNYPFFVKGETQAYAMLRDIKENYDERYAEFIEWRDEHFEPRFQPGGTYGDSLIDVATNGLNTILDVRESNELPESDMARALHAVVVPGETVTLIDLFDRAVKAGKVQDGTYVPKAWVSQNIPSSFKVNMQGCRVKLQAFFGAEDAGFEVGALKFP